jgi:DNA repair exonuclease SbcCD ATPase subunit
VNVRNISMRGVLCHTDTTLELPLTGVVLVTGKNGSGKSSIVEAASVAGWGKTLRGSDPWQPGVKKASVSLVAHGGLRIDRAKRAKGEDLTWSLTSTPGEVYENTTKAQNALEAVIGTWDVWRRCAVFSSHDAAHFTRATDGERKRLLESIIGLEKFDNALATCRLDLRTAMQRRAEAETNLATLCERQRAAEEAVVKAEQVLAGLPAPVERDVKALKRVDAECIRLLKLLDDARADMDDARGRLRVLDQSGGSYKAVAAQLKQTLQRIRDHAKCPTCTQTIPAKLRTDIEAQAAKATATAQEAQTKAKTSIAEVEALLTELQGEEMELQKKYSELNQQLVDAQAADVRDRQLAATRKQYEESLRAATATVAAAVAQRSDANAAAETWNREVAMLSVCEDVLGLKGVRAQVLGKALGGIEAVANVWLSKLVGNVTLKLLPYSEKKTGGTTDSIGIKIDGYGAGGGYKASSGGERRRVDVALVLALAEVAAASAGVEPSTLWFDEVFDTLDEEGVERACDALRQLAKDRCVVVISHSTTVGAKLLADVRWQVGSGGSVVTV